jgi:hypothetical protein
MDNPEKLPTLGTQDKDDQHNKNNAQNCPIKNKVILD